MKPKTTDEKIVEMVKISLKEGNASNLFRLSTILERRAQFEMKLEGFLSTEPNHPLKP